MCIFLCFFGLSIVQFFKHNMSLCNIFVLDHWAGEQWIAFINNETWLYVILHINVISSKQQIALQYILRHSQQPSVIDRLEGPSHVSESFVMHHKLHASPQHNSLFHSNGNMKGEFQFGNGNLHAMDGVIYVQKEHQKLIKSLHYLNYLKARKAKRCVV